jgi:toxic protein SymE
MQNKKLKVYQSYDSNNKSIPEIRLKGHWLNELGFSVGCIVTIQYLEDEIIIKKEDPV